MEPNLLIWNKITETISDKSFISFLESYKLNNEIYICGGCIRNIILNKENKIKDIDLFINFSRNETELFLKELASFGEIQYGQYNSPRLFLKDHKDLYIDIVPFYNFVVSPIEIKTINDLLCSFDFTANAIGIRIDDKQIFDPNNGLNDIYNRILRAVRLDFPERMVSNEIPLSAVSVFWFRLLHYQNKLDFEFSPETLQWILDNKYRYSDIKTFEKYFFHPDISKCFKTLYLNGNK